MSELQIPKDLLRSVIEEMIPVHKFLGVKLLDIDHGYAKLHLAYRPELIADPRANRLHGGIIAALIDSAGGAAAITTLTSQEDKLSTIDMRVDYLEPGKADDVVAEGRIIRSGNNVIVTEMTASHQHTGEVIAQGKGVYAVKRYGNS